MKKLLVVLITLLCFGEMNAQFDTTANSPWQRECCKPGPLPTVDDPWNTVICWPSPNSSMYIYTTYKDEELDANDYNFDDPIPVKSRLTDSLLADTLLAQFWAKEFGMISYKIELESNEIVLQDSLNLVKLVFSDQKLTEVLSVENLNHSWGCSCFYNTITSMQEIRKYLPENGSYISYKRDFLCNYSGRHDFKVEDNGMVSGGHSYGYRSHEPYLSGRIPSFMRKDYPKILVDIPAEYCRR